MWSIQRDVGIYKFRSIKHIHDNIPPPPFWFRGNVKRNLFEVFLLHGCFHRIVLKFIPMILEKISMKNYAEKGGSGGCVEPLWGMQGVEDVLNFLEDK